jgi:hypothetical protein
VISTGGADATAAYEHLRRHALEGSPRGVPFGVILVVREGVAAWIDRGATGCTTPSTNPDRAVPFPAVSLPLHAGIVDVLVSIALTTREETQV